MEYEKDWKVECSTDLIIFDVDTAYLNEDEKEEEDKIGFLFKERWWLLTIYEDRMVTGKGMWPMFVKQQYVSFVFHSYLMFVSLFEYSEPLKCQKQSKRVMVIKSKSPILQSMSKRIDRSEMRKKYHVILHSIAVEWNFELYIKLFEIFDWLPFDTKSHRANWEEWQGQLWWDMYVSRFSLNSIVFVMLDGRNQNILERKQEKWRYQSLIDHTDPKPTMKREMS